MRCPLAAIAALTACLLIACGGGQGTASSDASADGAFDGQADGGGDGAADRASDATAGAACNGVCSGLCRGLCNGICADRNDAGECSGRCEGFCLGGCAAGTCTRLSRPEAGAGVTVPDARPDRPVERTTEAGRGDRGSGDGGTADDAPTDDGAAPPDGGAAVDAPLPAAGGWSNRTRGTILSWPPASHAGAIAYDPVRRRTVMFGGWSQRTNATWEWDGAEGTWRLCQQAGGARPSPRFGHAMTFDGARRKIVLYGGVDESGTTSDEVWEWDGETEVWTRRESGPSPSRWAHAMAFDESTGRLVVFGGSHRHPTLGDGDLFDLWELEGTEWKNRTLPLPAVWPRARRGHAMAFDATRAVTVVYGGELAGHAAASQELWEWDGAAAAWRDRSVHAAGAPWPGPRVLHAMVSIGEGRIALFGNFAPNLWLWDGDAWRDLSGEATAPWPPARPHPALAFDSDRQVLVLSGGAVTEGRGELADLWEWSF